jgi:hypothetical protein
LAACIYRQIRLTPAIDRASLSCMAIEISYELLRLLGILSVRAHGATQYELAVLEGVGSNVTYQAVKFDLVCAHRQSDETYRFLILDAGRALLSPNDSGFARGH